MWWRAYAAALLLWCCGTALAVRGRRAADAGGVGGVGDVVGGGGALAAVAAGEAREARFVLGSRYGRSAPAPRFMSPRNDRFFMSSRYGKRSGASASASGMAGGGGAQEGRACRCGLYRPLLALVPARYTRRPPVGSTFRAG